LLLLVCETNAVAVGVKPSGPQLTDSKGIQVQFPTGNSTEDFVGTKLKKPEVVGKEKGVGHGVVPQKGHQCSGEGCPW
jgi:hypothetical protein